VSFKVFVSHDTADLALLDQLRYWLELNGIETASAQMFANGADSIAERSISAIRGSHCVLAILSRDGYRSQLADFELVIAAEAGRLIVPLVERGAALPSHLLNRDVIQFDRSDPAAAVSSVVAFLRNQKLAKENQQKLLAGAVLAIGLLAVAAGRKND
jgi:hypothetical protein